MARNVIVMKPEYHEKPVLISKYPLMTSKRIKTTYLDSKKGLNFISFIFAASKI